MSYIPTSTEWAARCFFCDLRVAGEDALIHYLSGKIVCRECADYNRAHGY